MYGISIGKGLACCGVAYSFYMENILGMMKPRKNDAGQYILGENYYKYIFRK
jgi:hypothetical protein